MAASGVEGVRKLSVRLVLGTEDAAAKARPAVSSGGEAKEAAASPEEKKPALAERRFLVRLHFVEPSADVKPGDRVFDVAIQGKTVLQNLDVAAEAGGTLKPVVRTWHDIAASDAIQIGFTPRSALPPVLCGVEIVEERR